MNAVPLAIPAQLEALRVEERPLLPHPHSHHLRSINPSTSSYCPRSTMQAFDTTQQTVPASTVADHATAPGVRDSSAPSPYQDNRADSIWSVDSASGKRPTGAGITLPCVIPRKQDKPSSCTNSDIDQKQRGPTRAASPRPLSVRGSRICRSIPSLNTSSSHSSTT